MKKKSTKEGHSKIDCNAYKCKICGKIVPPLRRTAYLILAHKLSGNNIKGLFINTGRKFVCGKSRVDRVMQKEYFKNLEKKEKRLICGTKTGYSERVKIIYTPMGNKR